MKWLLLTLFFVGCATSEKVIEVKNNPLCIQPDRPPITEMLESFDIDDLEKAYVCIKSDVACDEKSKVIIWFLIKDYAYKLAKYDAYSQRWEEYGKCIERSYKNDRKEK